ncbi:MAG: hypothetical protein RLZZ336_1794 [Cyanobacteriota bacterium]
MGQIVTRAVHAGSSPSSVGAPSVAALVPLFAPYLASLGAALEPALQILVQGQFSGERRLQDGRSHPYLLRWSGAAAPAEPSSCNLSFPGSPAVHYSFTVPTQRLLVWLAEADGTPGAEDLPDSFWRWLILGEVPAF